jgi:hypothetical protein
VANIDYRVNLSAAVFPMTVAKAGRSVIIPGPDQNFDRRIDAPGDNQRGSVGIPQILYGENILPTPDGLQSVGFKPRTAISLAASAIAAVTPVKVATITTTEVVSTGGTVLYASTGTDLSAWQKSGDNIPPGSYSTVTQAVNNFLLEISVGVTSVFPSYPWIKKAFDIGNPDNCSFEADITWSYSSITQSDVLIGLFTASGAVGLYVKLDYIANTIAFGSANDIQGTGFAAIDSDTPSSALTNTTQYRVEATLERTSSDPTDHTRLITVILKSSGGSTLATLTGMYTTALGTYCTFSYDSEMAVNSIQDTENFSLVIDNIDVTGDGVATTTTYTEYTGLASAYIAFRANNTAVWSYDLDTWDNYVVNVPVGFESPASPNKVSVANVRGVTYICVRRAATTKIYTAAVDTGANEIDITDITTTVDGTLPDGYSIDSILSIASSYNYLILCTGGTILWSSTTTPTDFAPSLVSGAGNEVPGNLKGDIAFLREHVSGFFIYSTKNVVFAQYTGNARYPWKFREVGGSGGFNLSTQISGDTNSAVQYGVNNTKFIQILSPDSAEIVAPEVTDFIERNTRWDLFNSATYAFSLSDATFSILPASKASTWFVLDRYLLLPYGMSDAATNLQWTFVLVYDSVLKRYGKLKFTFDFCLSDEENMFFIDRLTGAISRLYFDIHDQSLTGTTYQHNGIVVLGKFQYARSRWLSIERVDVETVQDRDVVAIADRQFACRILGTLDGKTFESAVTPYNNTPATSKKTVQFLAHKSCQNFALAFKGAFDMNSLQVQFHAEGDE